MPFSAISLTDLMLKPICSSVSYILKNTALADTSQHLVCSLDILARVDKDVTSLKNKCRLLLLLKATKSIHR